MKIVTKKALIKEKPLLKKLMRPYFDELSKFFGGSINNEEYRYLDLYWKEKERVPYLVYFGETPCGLVLVNEYTRLPQNKGAKTIAEFYITKKYRNQGVGKRVAEWIFNQFPGKWEVAVARQNIPALKFWEKVIGEYTKGKFTKVVLNDFHKQSWDGPVYSFNI